MTISQSQVLALVPMTEHAHTVEKAWRDQVAAPDEAMQRWLKANPPMSARIRSHPYRVSPTRSNNVVARFIRWFL